MPDVPYKTRLGHAHIKVRDLDQAVDFYTRYFGMRVTERVGNHYAFLTGSEYHHELALQNVGPNAQTPSEPSIGLYHIAFEVPDRASFARAYKTLVDNRVPVGAVDHLISWAMYLHDPDGNGLEIYWDTRREPGGREVWEGENVPLSSDKILESLASAGSE